MTDTITAEQAEDLRGILKDIYARHGLAHIFKTAHIHGDNGFDDEPTLNIVAVFIDESNATFPTDLPHRVAAKKDAIFKLADYFQNNSIDLTATTDSATESEYANFLKENCYAAAI